MELEEAQGAPDEGLVAAQGIAPRLVLAQLGHDSCDVQHELLVELEGAHGQA